MGLLGQASIPSTRRIRTTLTAVRQPLKGVFWCQQIHVEAVRLSVTEFVHIDRD